MSFIPEKYINPFTDFGFKKLFGEEPHKELLMDFLNELLRVHEGEITKLTYLKSEHLGASAIDRKAVFDLYCENERGEKFIVELQKAKQNFFKDRTLFYATFPIQDQSKRGDWQFELKAVYTVSILDFVFDENSDEPDKYRYDVQLTDIDTCKVFYKKLTFVYLEMPKFRKTLDELETRFDKWLYIIRNLEQLDEIPERLQERIFERLFEVAEVAKFSREERSSYQDSLKHYWDLTNVIDYAKETAREEGLEEGREAGREQGLEIGRKDQQRKTIKEGINAGLSADLLASLTGLPTEEVKAIIAEIEQTD